MSEKQQDILDLRQKCWVLFSHDWIPIPMVYTQVVTLSVYLFMLACLFGRQGFAGLEYSLINDGNSTAPAITGSAGGTGDRHAEYWFPFFTVCQIIFYLGWLKVGEIMINPLGEDADDFEINYIIDRNLRLSYSVVDYSYNRLPPVEKDIHWDKEEPDIPHTVASAKAGGTAPFIGSAANVTVEDHQAGITDIEVLRDAANAELPSRQTSSAVPTGLDRAHSKGERRVPSLLQSISRLLSKDNEAIDGVKSPPQATSPSTKALRRKKDSFGGGPSAVSSEVRLRALEGRRQLSVENGDQHPSRQRSPQPSHTRLAKIDESGAVLVQLLNESEDPQKNAGDGSMFYMSEAPLPKPQEPPPPPKSAWEKPEEKVDEEDEQSRHRLQRQDRNLPVADSPPVPTTKEPPSLM